MIGRAILYRITDMKQVKFQGTELSVSAIAAQFCVFSENQGLSLQPLQESLVLNEQLIGKAILYRRTDMKQVKCHRTDLSLSAAGEQFCALSENQGLSLQKLQERRVFNETWIGKAILYL